MRQAFAIFGPPGTGKSHEILSRVRTRLESGTDPKSICLLSFTRAAAQELADRAGLKGAQISTIHALAFKVLGLSRSQVMGNEDLREISRLTGCKMTLKSVDVGADLGEGDFYHAMYNLARSLQKDPYEGYDNTLSDSRCNAARYLRFIASYDKYKTANGLIDFGDMLERAALKPSPFYEYVFIDEAQDLSPAQWNLIEAWLPMWSEVHIAGDDDQSIYKWGGADPHGMAFFVSKYKANIKILRNSHRIPRTVHAVADRLVQQISCRMPKEYEPRQQEGAVFHVPLGFALTQLQHGRDTLVVYRNHAMRHDICKYLNMKHIPYVVDGGASPLTSALGKAAAIWNRCVRGGGHDLSSMQLAIIKKVANPFLLQRIKEKRLPHHHKWGEVFLYDREITPYLLHVEQKHGLNVVPTIHLSTIHGSKGREADEVIVIDAVSKRTYDTMYKDKDSEIRTFYVAVTRARQRLYICKSPDFKNRPTGLL